MTSECLLIKYITEICNKVGLSDIHAHSNKKITCRVNGQLVKQTDKLLSESDVNDFINNMGIGIVLNIFQYNNSRLN